MIESHEEKLVHLLYKSEAVPDLDSAELKLILEAARDRNSRRFITGMLLKVSSGFFQVLEGDAVTLNDLFARIKSDQRHTKVTLIIQEPIASRVFGDWTMGFAEADLHEMKDVDGFNDFFQGGDALARLKPGRARKILSAFAEGRWRARLDGEQE